MESEIHPAPGMVDLSTLNLLHRLTASEQVFPTPP
jgi:hypothetical protein